MITWSVHGSTVCDTLMTNIDLAPSLGIDNATDP